MYLYPYFYDFHFRKFERYKIKIVKLISAYTGNTTEQIFQKMKYASKENIHEYSVSLAPLQLEIIKPLPAKVKSLIKLMKYWKDKKLKVIHTNIVIFYYFRYSIIKITHPTSTMTLTIQSNLY